MQFGQHLDAQLLRTTARAHSEDLRFRLVRIVGNGHSAGSTAKLFAAVSASAVKSRAELAVASPSRRQRCTGRRRQILEPQVEWLLALVEEHPDLTLEEIRAEPTSAAIPQKSNQIRIGTAARAAARTF
jgi:transposase